MCPMPQDLFIREKFTKERTAARKLAAEYFQRFPKDHYLAQRLADEAALIPLSGPGGTARASSSAANARASRCLRIKLYFDENFP
jgi:hypothetical protein